MKFQYARSRLSIVEINRDSVLEDAVNVGQVRYYAVVELAESVRVVDAKNLNRVLHFDYLFCCMS